MESIMQLEIFRKGGSPTETHFSNQLWQTAKKISVLIPKSIKTAIILMHFSMSL
jgi:hypothetical protein